jgi:hypothetical protein
MRVHAVRVEAHALVLVAFLVIDRDQRQVDVGFIPHGVVRQAAAQRIAARMDRDRVSISATSASSARR